MAYQVGVEEGDYEETWALPHVEAHAGQDAADDVESARVGAFDTMVVHTAYNAARADTRRNESEPQIKPVKRSTYVVARPARDGLHLGLNGRLRRHIWGLSWMRMRRQSWTGHARRQLRGTSVWTALRARTIAIRHLARINWRSWWASTLTRILLSHVICRNK
jgi:hypothetical protein